MDNLRQTWYDVVDYLPAVIKAILIALVAWALASLVRWVIVKGGKKVKLPELMVKSKVASGLESAVGVLRSLGNLGFFIVLLVFIPAVFGTLNIPALSAPFENLLNGFLAFIPNLVGAILILFIGHLLSKVVKELITSISAGFGVDKLSNKIKQGDSGFKLSDMLGKLVYAFIMFSVIIAALHTLEINSISQPLIEMLGVIVNYVPRVIAAAVVIGIGVYLINFITRLFENVIRGTTVDRLLSKSTFSESAEGYFVLSKPLVAVVKYLLILLLMVEVFAMLQLEVFANVGRMILVYLPIAIGALAIVVVGMFAGNFCAKMFKKMGMSDLAAKGIKAIIYVMTVFMALSQLNLAKGLIEPAFLLIVGAIAVAFALAFGLGGKEFAKKTLEDVRKNKDNNNI